MDNRKQMRLKQVNALPSHVHPGSSLRLVFTPLLVFLLASCAVAAPTTNAVILWHVLVQPPIAYRNTSGENHCIVIS